MYVPTQQKLHATIKNINKDLLYINRLYYNCWLSLSNILFFRKKNIEKVNVII